MNGKIIFRFDASIIIGAGHAIRSMVLANRFKELDWHVRIATNLDSYNFIPNLRFFERIDQSNLLDGTSSCDILVIDSYDIDEQVEAQFRKHAKKIVVIDDLANRSHDCDILIDQTYGRLESDYKNLVPENCQILTGSNYVMLRSEFIQYRRKALEKRKKTKIINRVLITMGGSDPKNYSEIALKELVEAGFNGEVDIVAGFKENTIDSINHLIKSVNNKIKVHVNPNMPKLMYEADLSIGASGSRVWERCYLGLPSVLYLTADNQNFFYQTFINREICYSKNMLRTVLKTPYQLLSKVDNYCDGLGISRVIKNILF